MPGVRPPPDEARYFEQGLVPDTVWDILREGSKRARQVAGETMDEVRAAMKTDYRNS